ncbi:hypothetical protein Tco_0675151 [Tanacetum coccineum]
MTQCRDEALMIQGNRSDGYASIVASEKRAELFDRIGILERDNMRLKVMLGVERQRVDRLWHSMSSEKDHEEHFKLILELLKKEEL